MKKAFFPTCLICICFFTNAQAISKNNSIYIELGGNAIYGSINYERLVKAGKGNMGFRIGAGYYSGNQQFRLCLPIGVNYLVLLNHTHSFIDLGFGLTWASAPGLVKETANGYRDYSKHIINYVPSLGWRTHFGKSYMFRASLMPIINSSRTIPYLGLSFGKLL